MKKRILTLAVMFCLVFSLAACGGDSSSGDTEETAQETTEGTEDTEEAEDTADAGDVSDGSVTLEGYFNSDVMQTMVESAREQYEEQGITSAMYAEGDVLKYDFTINEMVGLSDEERSIFSDTLKASMEASESSFQNTADQAKAIVSNETVTLVVTYYDGDGNVLYTQSFTAAE